jgi:F-type H+-transporting ATPase subunit a
VSRRHLRRVWLPVLALAFVAYAAPIGIGPAGAQHEAEAEGEHAGDHAGRPTGEHGAEHEPHYHLPSFVDLIVRALPGGPEGAIGRLVVLFQPTIFGLLAALFIALVVGTTSRSMKLIPGRLQMAVESLIGGLDGFIRGVLGPDGGRYVPFLGTLFIYIWLMNVMGLVPFLMSPTSKYHMTAALAATVFLYVQYTGFRRNGPGRYLFHLAGEPRDIIGWSMVPLMLPLHVIGEFAKPLSLSLRLFGNIFGEDTLIAVFAILGVGVLSFLNVPVGLPLHVPFVFLALLLGTIQALVFTLLSTIYFALVLPHEHEEH